MIIKHLAMNLLDVANYKHFKIIEAFYVIFLKRSSYL